MLRGHHHVTLTRVSTLDGLLFDLDVENVMDYAVLDHGYYEREVLDAILECAAPDAVLWDVGGNIGLHAISTKHLRPDVTVVVFEPTPHTAARLIGNAELNGMDIEVVTAALSETDGIARLSIVTRGNNGLSSLRPWPDVDYARTIVCPCARAATLVEQGMLPAPTIVKLDVEGFEAEVLRGFGSRLTDATLGAVIFEAPGAAADRLGETEVFAMLRGAGFDITPLAPATTSEKSVATNFLAKRR